MAVCHGFMRMNMHMIRKKFGFAMSAVLAALLGFAAIAQARNEPPKPSYYSRVYIEYYINGAPSGVISTEAITHAPTLQSCQLEVLIYASNQYTSSGYRYIFHRADPCVQVVGAVGNSDQ
jgi:hypothetical protein